MTLKKIISGGQSGADLSGLIAAKSCGIPTGGTMPNGWRTLDGSKPEYAEQFGMVEHTAWSYVPRTFQNVKESSGTIRFAYNFESSGEKCTLKAIKQYERPYFDVKIKDPAVFSVNELQHPKNVAEWIVANKIEILNVAGNSEHTCSGIGKWVERFMIAVIAELRNIEGSTEHGL